MPLRPSFPTAVCVCTLACSQPVPQNSFHCTASAFASFSFLTSMPSHFLPLQCASTPFLITMCAFATFSLAVLLTRTQAGGRHGRERRAGACAGGAVRSRQQARGLCRGIPGAGAPKVLTQTQWSACFGGPRFLCVGVWVWAGGCALCLRVRRTHPLESPVRARTTQAQH